MFASCAIHSILLLGHRSVSSEAAEIVGIAAETSSLRKTNRECHPPNPHPKEKKITPLLPGKRTDSKQGHMCGLTRWQGRRRRSSQRAAPSASARTCTNRDSIETVLLSVGNIISASGLKAPYGEMFFYGVDVSDGSLGGPGSTHIQAAPVHPHLHPKPHARIRARTHTRMHVRAATHVHFSIRVSVWNSQCKIPLFFWLCCFQWVWLFFFLLCPFQLFYNLFVPILVSLTLSFSLN